MVSTISTVINTKSIKSVRRPLVMAEPVRRPNGWWRGSPFGRRQQPTTFQKCLALHIYLAERAGALD